MHLLLIIGAALLFAFSAPIKLTLLTAAGLLIVGYAGQRATRAITGAPASVIEVFRSVGLAFLFVTVLGFATLSMGGSFSGLGLVLMVLAFLLAYVAGFRLGMGIDLVAASVVAGVTTLVSLLLVALFRPLL